MAVAFAFTLGTDYRSIAAIKSDLFAGNGLGEGKGIKYDKGTPPNFKTGNTLVVTYKFALAFFLNLNDASGAIEYIANEKYYWTDEVRQLATQPPAQCDII